MSNSMYSIAFNVLIENLKDLLTSESTTWYDYVEMNLMRLPGG